MKTYKILFSIFISLILLSCDSEKAEKKKTEPAPVKEFYDFLVGDWVRINNRADQITYESWSRVNTRELKGFGWTMENADTVFQETMLLREMGGDWYFVVTGENEEDTPFLITEKTMDSFTCKNELNEFPKKIVYSYNDSLLSAVISADSTAVLFHFKPFNK